MLGLGEERTPEEMAERHVLWARIELWAWVVFTIPYMIFLRESVAVVGLLSIYALIITARGVMTSAQAEVAGYANPPMEEDSEE